MTGILDLLIQRAQSQPRSIVFPEASDPRVLQAVQQLTQHKICRCIVVDPPDEVSRRSDWLRRVELRSTHNSRLHERYAQRLYQRRAVRGMTLMEARKEVLDPLMFAVMMVALGDVDLGIAGSVATTATVLRKSVWGIGPLPGQQVVSSFFLMQSGERVLTMADCAVVPEPSVEQLAEIAICAAANHQRLTLQPPLVAMLSFSTLGSAPHPNTEKVRAACELVRRQRPDLRVDGELQLDAAIDPSVAQRKAPASPVAGQANVLIFPNLDAGNIGYKIMERFAGFQAIGPIVQGLAQPFMDLSRGCSVPDIVNVAVVGSAMCG